MGDSMQGLEDTLDEVETPLKRRTAISTTEDEAAATEDQGAPSPGELRGKEVSSPTPGGLGRVEEYCPGVLALRAPFDVLVDGELAEVLLACQTRLREAIEKYYNDHLSKLGWSVESALRRSQQAAAEGSRVEQERMVAEALRASDAANAEKDAALKKLAEVTGARDLLLKAAQGSKALQEKLEKSYESARGALQQAEWAKSVAEKGRAAAEELAESSKSRLERALEVERRLSTERDSALEGSRRLQAEVRQLQATVDRMEVEKEKALEEARERLEDEREELLEEAEAERKAALAHFQEKSRAEYQAVLDDEIRKAEEEAPLDRLAEWVQAGMVTVVDPDLLAQVQDLLAQEGDGEEVDPAGGVATVEKDAEVIVPAAEDKADEEAAAADVRAPEERGEGSAAVADTVVEGLLPSIPASQGPEPTAEESAAKDPVQAAPAVTEPVAEATVEGAQEDTVGGGAVSEKL